MRQRLTRRALLKPEGRSASGFPGIADRHIETNNETMWNIFQGIE